MRRIVVVGLLVFAALSLAIGQRGTKALTQNTVEEQIRLLEREWLVLLIRSGTTAVAKAQDLSAFFKNTEGAFVLYDLKHDRYIRYNEARCRKRFSPKSTFKIPNSLIGLETGVISDANFLIHWDRQKYPPQDNWNQEPFNHWAQDQTLRSAIKYSVVWYYKELAKRVGENRMQRYIAAFNYGNKNISGGVDNFWLNNSLKISADEQINFLKAFYTGKLPVSKRSASIVKDILVLEETPAYKLSGKTGGGPINEGTYIGWFVGYLETKGNVYFFATNIGGSNFAEIRDKRVQITKQILIGLGYLPKSQAGLSLTGKCQSTTGGGGVSTGIERRSQQASEKVVNIK